MDRPQHYDRPMILILPTFPYCLATFMQLLTISS